MWDARPQEECMMQEMTRKRQPVMLELTAAQEARLEALLLSQISLHAAPDLITPKLITQVMTVAMMIMLLAPFTLLPALILIRCIQTGQMGGTLVAGVVGIIVFVLVLRFIRKSGNPSLALPEKASRL